MNGHPTLSFLDRAGVVLDTLHVMHDAQLVANERSLSRVLLFVQEIGRVPLGYRFVSYKGSAFSFDLSEDLVAMRASGYISLEPRPYPDGPVLAKGPAGPQLAGWTQDSLAEYRDCLRATIALVCDLNEPLPVLANALYAVLREHDREGRIQRLTHSRPRVEQGEADRALRTVDELMHRGVCPA